jgi:hypothetical protein
VISRQTTGLKLNAVGTANAISKSADSRKKRKRTRIQNIAKTAAFEQQNLFGVFNIQQELY